jgi:hypothetical protein
LRLYGIRSLTGAGGALLWQRVQSQGKFAGALGLGASEAGRTKWLNRTNSILGEQQWLIYSNWKNKS